MQPGLITVVVSITLITAFIAIAIRRGSTPHPLPLASYDEALFPDADLMQSEDYWRGLAAGSRYLGQYRSKADVIACWEGIDADRRFGDQSEREFAIGWQRSVLHLYDQVSR